MGDSFSLAVTTQARNKAEAKKRTNSKKRILKQLEWKKQGKAAFSRQGPCHDAPGNHSSPTFHFLRPRDLGHPSLLRQFVLLFGLSGPHQWDKSMALALEAFKWSVFRLWADP